MKAPHNLYGKKLLSLLILLLLILNLLSALNVNITKVSAVEYPAIMVVPEITTDLTPGTSFTVSIYTDYGGFDTTSYQFTLSYDPNVLHGGINNTDTWAGNGANTTFFTTQKPISDSEKVYVNQILMTKPANYTIDYAEGKITLFLATDTWIGNNVTTVFYITQKPIVPGSEKVYWNGKLTTDYTINYTKGEITFRIPPELGDEIKVTYRYPPGVGAEIKAIYLYNGVTNGEVIVGGSATFLAGPFDNTAGNLSLTMGFYDAMGQVTGMYRDPPWNGTLAYVTFTVVGYGASNIKLGPQTRLYGWNFTPPAKPYYIIDAETMPDHIQHGYFANGGSIAGTVTDAQTGEAIAGANVTANGMSTTTNSSGAYVTPNLPPGTYTVNASKPGYYSNSTSATVVTGEPTTGIDFTLQLIVGWIDGYVTDNATIPIANATVMADTVASDTNNTGYYKIEIVPGTYTLTALMSGYYPHSIHNVSVSANETVTRNFTLERLPVTGWINGTVTDNATPPEPIEGATVTADVFLGFTDETGYYSIMAEAPRNYTITASMSGYYDGVEYDVPVYENATTPVNFTLQLIVGWIDGYVTDANAGSAIVGAKVTADGVSDLTDAEGHYNIEVRPGDYAVNASKPGYYSNSTSVTVDPEKTTSVNFTLTPLPGAIAGTVTDASTGNPIVDTPVQADSYSNTTDADGYYLIADVPPGNYTVKILAVAGYYSDSKSATVEPKKTTTLNFALQRKVGWIDGTVTDASTGDPIYNATVTADGYSTTTDIDGEYTIPADLLPGTYTVEVSKTGYISNSTSGTVYAGYSTPVNFELMPLLGAINGTVTDALTGEAIAGANVTANGMSTTINSSGAYVISDVQLGTYTVTVSADGYESDSKSATVVAGETIIVDFELTPTSTPPPPIPWYLYAAAAGVVAIIMVAVAFYFLKIRKPKPT